MKTSRLPRVSARVAVLLFLCVAACRPCTAAPSAAGTGPAIDAPRSASLARAAADTSLSSWQREIMLRLADGGSATDPAAAGVESVRSPQAPTNDTGTWFEYGMPARSYHTAVCDSLRDRMIVFGGQGSSGFFNDVWVVSLSGTSGWFRLVPSGAPPSARAYHTAIFDRPRDRMLVFGGMGASGVLGDVWELTFAGTPAWHQLSPSGTPPGARRGHCAIVDLLRDRMVVFGGSTATGVTNDVWALSLSGPPAWTALSPTGTAPSARSGHSGIYDPIRDRMVVFGGGSTSDVWALSLAGTPSWTTLATAGTAPSPRYDHRAVYDPAGDRMVVYGGHMFTFPFEPRDVRALSLGDTLTWTSLGNGAAGREGMSGMADLARDCMVLNGGQDQSIASPSPYFNDTYVLSLAGGGGSSSVTAPIQGQRGGTFYDPVRDRIVSCVNGASIWTLSPTAGSASQLLTTAGTPPAGRLNGTATYDPVRDQVVVFGGYDGTTYLDDVWTLSLAGTPTWAHITPMGAPPQGRYWHSTVFDPVGDRMIVFGGVGASGYFSDVWALSLSEPPRWQQLVPTGTPPHGRSGQTAVYDALRNRVLVFGGTYYAGSIYNLNDTWALSLGENPAWAALAPTGSLPFVRSSHSAIYDPLRDRVVIFGGCVFSKTSTLYLADTWALSLSGTPAWASVWPGGTAPSKRRDHAAVYDPVRDQMVVLGGDATYYDTSIGSDLSIVLKDFWVLVWGSAGWVVNASAGSHGHIAPVGSVIVADGATPTFDCTPDLNCHVADVLVNGVSAGATTHYTFAPVHANQTIAASFAMDCVLPAPPLGLTVTNSGTSKSLKLAWNESTTAGVTGYEIYRSGGGADAQFGPVSGLSYTDDGLTRGTNYIYQVAAIIACGTGSRSTGVSGSPNWYPVLFVHGICSDGRAFTDCTSSAFPCELSEDVKKIGDAFYQLQDAPHDLHLFEYTHDRPLSEIAPLLAARIDAVLEQTHQPQLNIIAHSQGGLISRWLLQRDSRYSAKVQNLIMIGTPNHGSEWVRAMYAQPLLSGVMLPFWLLKLSDAFECLSFDPARFDLWPDSDFLNELNYPGGPREDVQWLGCNDSPPNEDLAGSTAYWLLAGTGGWCGVKTAAEWAASSLGLCSPNDGVVSTSRINLSAVAADHKGQDDILGSQPKHATHFSGSAGSCNVEELQHITLIGAALNILTLGRIPTSPGPARQAAARRARAGAVSGDAPSDFHALGMFQGSIGAGESQPDTITVDGGGEVVFLLSAESGGLHISLRSPSGREISAADTSLGDVQFESDSTLAYEALSLTAAEPGPWAVVTHADVGIGQQRFTVEAHARSSLWLRVEPFSNSGSAVPRGVRAWLEGLTGSVGTLGVTGRLALPDSTAASLAFYDDGAHGDGVAGDGVFGALIPDAHLLGAYGAEVVASVDSAGRTIQTRRGVASFTVTSVADAALAAADIATGRVCHQGCTDTLEIRVSLRNIGTAPGTFLLKTQEGTRAPFLTAELAVDAGGVGETRGTWVPAGASPETLLVFVDPLSPSLQTRYDNDSVRVVVDPATVSAPASGAVRGLQLGQGYPNPGHGPITIQFALPRAGEVRLCIYDVAGRSVRTAVDGLVPAGVHMWRWDARGDDGLRVAAGVYFYELRLDAQRLARRLVILR